MTSSESDKLAALSPGDRAEVRALAAAVLEAVRCDASIPLAANIGRHRAHEYPGSVLVYHADDVEGLLTRASQEIETLTRERNQWLQMARSAAHMARAYIEVAITDAGADDEETDGDLGQCDVWLEQTEEPWDELRKAGA